MIDKYTVARFWKVALQVNPYNYNEKYRGNEHGFSEIEYNQELARICKEEDIKIVGIADHGNVDSIDGMRSVLEDHGIIVFPGFEIASSEKIHFVCLFPEATSKDALNRYLGNLELTDPEDGVRPSKLSGEILIKKVNELGGFIYAAHATDKSGLLKSKNQYIWKNRNLVAVQIPRTIEDLEGEDAQFFRSVLQNQKQCGDYMREKPMAVINAKDVEKPDTLRKPEASCLIKMTQPCFQAFKDAFLDPESRIRLNFDIPNEYYSKIVKVSFTGGYLDGIEINPFSEHLNTIIGGRGTGKTTLIESIRYALDRKPIGKEAQKRHDEIIKENLSKEKAQIQLEVRSHTKNGNKFTVLRKYPDPPIVKDNDGNISHFEVSDILPNLDILGQNEILEIAEDKDSIQKVLFRFLPKSYRDTENKINECLNRLKENSEKLSFLEESKADLDEKMKQLPKLQEEAKQYEKLGIEGIVKEIPLLEKERSLLNRVNEEYERVEEAINTLQENLPDTTFLGENAIQNLPHREIIQTIKENLDLYKQEIESLLNSLTKVHKEAKERSVSTTNELADQINKNEKKIEDSFKEIPSMEGKSGKEIGISYQSLLKSIEKIKPLDAQKKTLEENYSAFLAERKELLAELTELRTEKNRALNNIIKPINKKLDQKIKINLVTEGSRSSMIRLLSDFQLEGIGEKKLQWIQNAEGLSSLALVRTIEKGKEALEKSKWGITPYIADALLRLTPSQRRSLEVVDFPDMIDIELNVSHQAEDYKKIDSLSTGQKCTAILHLLLLENKDPLIMDQPEDNLDNAFIADRIVEELRLSKLKRQFLFATHNANIPVFGDSEWIGIMESTKDGATLPEDRQGSIDSPKIKEFAAAILEGGRSAFLQRKEKYGFD